MSHLLYLSSWLQDTVKCMEVVLFQGCLRNLNSFTSCLEKCGSLTVPNIGWSRAVFSVSVVDEVWSCMCIIGTLAQRLIPRSVFLITGTELFPWATIPTAVFVFFLSKLNRTKKDLAVTISWAFNLLNPQNILQNINSLLLLACLWPVFLLT